MAVSNPTGADGRAGFIDRGVWSGSPSPAYALATGVRRPNVGNPVAGGYFLALAAGLTTDPLIDTSHWSQLGADGATGATSTLATGLDGNSAATGNDARLMTSDPPVVNGLIAMSCRPREGVGNGRPGAGTLILQKIWLPSPATITNLTFIIAATGSANQTDFRMGLYSSAGSLLAGSSNASATVNGNNTIGAVITIALSAPYSWAGGTNAYFYAAYLAIGGTPPAPIFSATNTPIVDVNVATGAKNQMQLGAQGSLPLSVTLASLSVNTAAMWLGLS